MPDAITRRTFLIRTGHATLACASLASMGLAATPSLAQTPKLLGSDEEQSMLALARQLFPHDKLGDQYYQVAVDGIAGEMAGSADLAARIRDGFHRLDAVFGMPFRRLSEGNQVHAIRTMEGTPFFADMLGKANFYFYNNKKVWRHFGYEGSSFELGGYLERGFDDIGWLRSS